MVSSKAVSSKPRRLTPIPFEKVWGSTQLEPWFPNSDKKIGEFWFTEEGSPLLIKFLFTTENLSVQVHPNDEQARQLEMGSRGKTEMWHILRAEPEAKLALGVVRDLTRDELREACLDGSIMDLLRWVPAIAGQTWFIPAGTIHAIGAGITLAEIQQASDITYRLYDYNRGRELHVDKGILVSDVRSRPETAGESVKCQYFHTDIVKVSETRIVGPGFFVVLSGEGQLGDQPIRAGEVWVVGDGLLQGEVCGMLVGEGCR
jgi:mannose-6-phosphate isomerase